jgi:hypothetical protein
VGACGRVTNRQRGGEGVARVGRDPETGTRHQGTSARPTEPAAPAPDTDAGPPTLEHARSVDARTLTAATLPPLPIPNSNHRHDPACLPDYPPPRYRPPVSILLLRLTPLRLTHASAHPVTTAAAPPPVS